MANDLATAIINTANQLKIDPVDLGTAISYETGGTFDPWKAGPTTQWGQHRGLIQWGEPQRRQYGVYQGMPDADQMRAVGSYLTDAGVRPGMGLADIYSAINAGRVGRYRASDANNGGAPGTVLDKVASMGPHHTKAAQLLGAAAPPEPILGADRRQAAVQEQIAAPPAAQQPEMPMAGQQSPIGAMLTGFMQGFAPQNAGPTVKQDDSPQVATNAAGLAEKGRQLKSAFLPNIENILSMGKRPTVV